MNPIILDYLPILIFIGVAIVVSAALMGSSFILAKSNPTMKNYLLTNVVLNHSKMPA